MRSKNLTLTHPTCPTVGHTLFFYTLGLTLLLLSRWIAQNVESQPIDLRCNFFTKRLLWGRLLSNGLNKSEDHKEILIFLELESNNIPMHFSVKLHSNEAKGKACSWSCFWRIAGRRNRKIAYLSRWRLERCCLLSQFSSLFRLYYKLSQIID